MLTGSSPRPRSPGVQPQNSLSGLAPAITLEIGPSIASTCYTTQLIASTPSNIEDDRSALSKQRYRDRSPKFLDNALKAPLLLIFGEDDKTVPSKKARDMSEASGRCRFRHGFEPLVTLLGFVGEGHTLSDPRNAKLSILEEAWWSKTLLN